MKNILEYLEKAAEVYPNKEAFSDREKSVTYLQVLNSAKAIGTKLSQLDCTNKPIAVYIDKSAETLMAFFGVVYSGNFYVVMDTKMPKDRADTIFNTLSPVAIVTNKANEENARQLNFGGEIFVYEDIVSTEADDTVLKAIRRTAIDTDPLYALFTSGSTGVPKGAVVSHRNVMAYADWVTEAFDINEKTVFGNQTPFYFSMSVLDIFSAIKNAATVHIIPKQLFSFPLKLLEYINKKNINIIYWVPSALCIVANWKALDYVQVPKLKKVLFAGEVMPTKQLNMLVDKMPPDTMFANLYGPTEVTDICTYYVLNRKIPDDKPLPIGGPCNNCAVMVVNADGKQAAPQEEGELYVRGSIVAMGYFNNPEKTKDAFVQNPLNSAYPEFVYKTGDIVKYNEYGELVYLSRKDFQIKHMGYRIELGEIEAAISAVDKISASACIYDGEKEKIVLIYTGSKIDNKYVMDALKTKLPNYMCPNKMIHLKAMPYNANGKVDRVWLKNNYRSLKSI